MKITENQLYEMFSNNLNKILMEAPKQQNDGPSIDGNFNQEYVDKNINKRGLTGPDAPNSSKVNGKYVGAKAGKALLGAAGMRAGTILGAAAMGAMAGVGGATLALGNVLNVVGLGILAGQFVGNLTALNKLSKLEFPKNPQNAMKYARYAAAERVNAQQICLNIQQNLKNAMVAWNQLNPNNTYNWQMLLNLIQGQGGDVKAKFKDRGQNQEVDVDIDKNFTDKNVGQNESIEHGRLLEAAGDDYKNVVKSVADFKIEFQQDPNQALTVLIYIGQAYIQSYGLWMQWTRYINVLVHKFHKYGVTWERVINANNGFGVKNTLITFANELFGTKIPLEDRDGNDEYQGSNQTSDVILRLVEPDWGTGARVGRYAGMSYILLQQDKTNNYFAVEPIGNMRQTMKANEVYSSDNGDGTMEVLRYGNGRNQGPTVLGTAPNFKDLSKGQGVNYKYSQNQIISTTKDPNGKNIYILTPLAVLNMTLFDD